MKWILLACLTLISPFAFGDTPDISIPDHYIQLIKTTDYVEVTGTNDGGGSEDFSIHNAKAISQFVHFLTDDIFNGVPKNLKPEFKSKSAYTIRLSSNGPVVLELKIIADSILDLPNEPLYYMESDRHSDNFMAPLLRLR